MTVASCPAPVFSSQDLSAEGESARLSGGSLIAGSVMASIAIEGFSPARLAETDGREIATRMHTLRELVHFDLDPVS